MINQYKPSKPKKEKPAKAPKAPKAEKAVKFNSSVQAVKTSKPAKAPKTPKPEKAVAIKPGKVEKMAKYKVSAKSGSGVMTKAVNPKIVLAVIAALIVVAVVVVVVAVPAVNKHGQEIDHIEITREPDKLVYLVGEEADYDGLRVTVTRNNGETFVVRAADCEITGFSSDYAVESCIVTVSYQGFSDILSLKILENEKPKPVLESIRLEPDPKTTYKYGELLDVSGIYMVREYVDGSTVTVNLLSTDVYGWDKITGPGTYELTVRYGENGVLCTYTYTITVTN